MLVIPEKLTRLQTTMFVDGATLSTPKRGAMIRAAATEMARGAMHKIIEDAIRTEDWLGHEGQTLHLDVYVLSPSELHTLLKDAYIAGQKARWPV